MSKEQGTQIDNAGQEQIEGQQTEGQAEGQEKTEGQEQKESDAQSRIQQLTNDLEATKQEKELLQQNIALIKANAPQPAPVEQFDIFKHAGLNPEDPDDVPNQKQLKTIISHIQGRYQDEINQLRFMVENPDYSEVVGTIEQIRAGQFGEPLREAIKANPALIATIQSSAQPQVAAYSIAKLYKQNKDKGQKTTATEAQDVIDQAVKQANKVKTSANTKGGSALTGESRYEAMSDEEFVALAQKNGANF